MSKIYKLPRIVSYANVCNPDVHNRAVSLNPFNNETAIANTVSPNAALEAVIETAIADAVVPSGSADEAAEAIEADEADEADDAAWNQPGIFRTCAEPYDGLDIFICVCGNCNTSAASAM